jgi:hypothetical protein
VAAEKKRLEREKKQAEEAVEAAAESGVGAAVSTTPPAPAWKVAAEEKRLERERKQAEEAAAAAAAGSGAGAAAAVPSGPAWKVAAEKKRLERERKQAEEAEAARAPESGAKPGLGGRAAEPPEAGEAVGRASEPSAATSDWKEVVGGDGKPYYYNKATRVTQWERPAAMDMDARPRAPPAAAAAATPKPAVKKAAAAASAAAAAAAAPSGPSFGGVMAAKSAGKMWKSKATKSAPAHRREPSEQKTTGKQAILVWAQNMTKNYRGVELTNLSTCWKDGLAFAAIMHRFAPQEVDYAALYARRGEGREAAMEAMALAWRVAEEKFDVAALLDQKDMTREVPDEKTVAMYLAALNRDLKDTRCPGRSGMVKYGDGAE